MNNKKTFLTNLLYAFGAQGVSLIISFLVTLIIPKVLGITAYSYWQLFIFYIAYAGFFHLGYNDGNYLRLGGMEYKNIDFDNLGTQFKLFFTIECIVAIAIICGAIICIKDYNRKIIVAIAAIYLILNNTALFYGYIFQAVNRTKFFSISVIIESLFILFFLIIFILNNCDSFIPYILVYTASKLFNLAFCAYKGKEIFFSKCVNLKESIKDMWISLSVGINLMLSNIMGMLILGIGRIVIDNHWGIKQFGKLSFSLSLMNFFLLFIQQISMVLFPALRKSKGDTQKSTYQILRSILGFLLPLVFVIYVPLKMFLSTWLPQYTESLTMLALFLPICVFDGKMQMLCNTYLKVLREEKKLLAINVVSVCSSVILCLVSSYLFNNLSMVALSMTASIIIRYILAELYLSKRMEISLNKSIIQEIILVITFISITSIYNNGISFIIITIMYISYLVTNKKQIVDVIRYIKKW